jgi:UDP-glucuronate 4-epimerase
MRVLVTGAAGFIGSHLCEALLQRGYEVTAMDNFDSYYDPAIKRRNISGFQERVRLVEGDIRSEKALGLALKDVDAVAHLAARAGVRASLGDPGLYVDNNVGGTQNLLQAMVERDILRLVFASSSSVYGSRTSGPFREDEPVLEPVSPYAATKLSGEYLCRAAHKTWGMQVSNMRLFTVYGPRQRPEMAIHLFARLASKGLAIPRFGTGESVRDYTYVADIVEGLIAAIEIPCGYRVFNLGNDNPISLNALIAHLGQALGSSIRVDSHGDQPGDVPRTWASIDRAKEELGYSPAVPLEAGLERFVAWLNQQSA